MPILEGSTTTATPEWTSSPTPFLPLPSSGTTISNELVKGNEIMLGQEAQRKNILTGLQQGSTNLCQKLPLLLKCS